MVVKKGKLLTSSALRRMFILNQNRVNFSYWLMMNCSVCLVIRFPDGEDVLA